jgi:CBS domain-containing protein
MCYIVFIGRKRKYCRERGAMLHPLTAQAFIVHALTVMRSVTDAALSVAEHIVPVVADEMPELSAPLDRALNGEDAEALAEVSDLVGEVTDEDMLRAAIATAAGLAEAYAEMAVTLHLPKPVNLDEVEEAVQRMLVIGQSL